MRTVTECSGLALLVTTQKRSIDCVVHSSIDGGCWVEVVEFILGDHAAHECGIDCFLSSPDSEKCVDGHGFLADGGFTESHAHGYLSIGKSQREVLEHGELALGELIRDEGVTGAEVGGLTARVVVHWRWLRWGLGGQGVRGCAPGGEVEAEGEGVVRHDSFGTSGVFQGPAAGDDAHADGCEVGDQWGCDDGGEIGHGLGQVGKAVLDLGSRDAREEATLAECDRGREFIPDGGGAVNAVNLVAVAEPAGEGQTSVVEDLSDCCLLDRILTRPGHHHMAANLIRCRPGGQEREEPR